MDTLGLMFGGVLLTALSVYLIHFLARRLSRRWGETAANRSSGEKLRPLIRPGFVLSLFLIYLGVVCWMNIDRWWPPAWLSRHNQRSEVFHRVEQAGGWERLTADVAIFTATNSLASPIWFSAFNTNLSLPISIAQLKPVYMEVHPGSASNAVLFRIFLGHRRHPDYSLYVCSTLVETEAQIAFRERLFHAATVRQIAPGVFEVY